MTRHEKALAILREGTIIPATTLALDDTVCRHMARLQPGGLGMECG